MPVLILVFVLKKYCRALLKFALTKNNSFIVTKTK